MNTARRAAAVSIALGALLLTGCATAALEDTSAAAPEPTAEATVEPESGQTVAEACALMQGSLEELVTYMSGANVGDVTSDPTAAMELFRATESAMREASDGVTNPDVADLATGAADAMSEYVVFLDEMSADPANVDLSALGEQAASLQAGIGGLGEVCSA